MELVAGVIILVLGLAVAKSLGKLYSRDEDIERFYRTEYKNEYQRRCCDENWWRHLHK